MNQLGTTITSLDVAEMVEREHRSVIRDIRTIIKHLGGQHKSVQTYFIDSEYKDSQGRNQFCYKLTKKGCELYSTRMTGEKGTQFAVAYIERFNQMENHIKQNSIDTTQFSPELRALISIEKRQIESDKKVEQLAGQVNNISNIVSITNVDWRKKVDVILKKIARNWTGVEPYRSVRNLSYERLEERAACNLTIRLNNRKERAVAQGMTKSYVQKINKLDCIAEEKRLVEIYLQVVKEMAIQFRIDVNDFEEVI